MSLDPVLIELPERLDGERTVLMVPRAGLGAELAVVITQSLSHLRPWMPWAQDAPSAESAELVVRRMQADFIARRDLCFQIYARRADGSPGRVNDLLRWAEGRLLVLVFGAVGPAALARLRGLCEAAPVRCVQVLGPEDPAGALEHVRDPKGHLQGACHVFGHAWALVRPDSYVAATGETVDATLVHAMGQALGTALEDEAA